MIILSSLDSATHAALSLATDFPTMSTLPPPQRVHGKRRERLWLEQQLMRELGGRLPYMVGEWSDFELMQRLEAADMEKAWREERTWEQEHAQSEQADVDYENADVAIPISTPLVSFLPLPHLSSAPSNQTAAPPPSHQQTSTPHRWTVADRDILESAIVKHGKSWTNIARDPSFVFSSSIQNLDEKQRINKLKSYHAFLLRQQSRRLAITSESVEEDEY